MNILLIRGDMPTLVCLYFKKIDLRHAFLIKHRIYSLNLAFQKCTNETWHYNRFTFSEEHYHHSLSAVVVSLINISSSPILSFWGHFLLNCPGLLLSNRPGFPEVGEPLNFYKFQMNFVR